MQAQRFCWFWYAEVRAWHNLAERACEELSSGVLCCMLCILHLGIEPREMYFSSRHAYSEVHASSACIKLVTTANACLYMYLQCCYVWLNMECHCMEEEVALAGQPQALCVDLYLR